MSDENIDEGLQEAIEIQMRRGFRFGWFPRAKYKDLVFYVEPSIPGMNIGLFDHEDTEEMRDLMKLLSLVPRILARTMNQSHPPAKPEPRVDDAIGSALQMLDMDSPEMRQAKANAIAQLDALLSDLRRAEDHARNKFSDAVSFKRRAEAAEARLALLASSQEQGDRKERKAFDLRVAKALWPLDSVEDVAEMLGEFYIEPKPYPQPSGLREAAKRALAYIEADEESHGRTFGEGNDLRAALAQADREGEMATFLRRQIEWSRKTFGPEKRTLGILRHIEKEIQEVKDKPSDLSEWLDIIILAIDGYWRHGGTPEGLMADINAKAAINHARVYPTPTSEDEAVEHVRAPHA